MTTQTATETTQAPMSQWQIERAAEREQTTKTLRSIARAIDILTGGAWVAVEHYNIDYREAVAWIDLVFHGDIEADVPDNQRRTFHLSIDTYRKKVSISAVPPKSRRGSTLFWGDIKCPSASFTATRPTVDIAKEAFRRVIDPGFHVLTTAMGRVRDIDANDEYKAEMANRLVEQFGGRTGSNYQGRDKDGSFWLSSPLPTGRCSSDGTVRLEAFSCTFEQAVRILDILTETKKGA